MEFVLLPQDRGNPPIPVPKTPYVCYRRYDGGPFLSYPMRVGNAEAAAAFFDLGNYHRAERVNPTPLRDKESFIQTWLYFGFISDFLLANSHDDSSLCYASKGSKEIIDKVYDMIVVTDGDSSYISLDDGKLNQLLLLTKVRLPGDKDARVKHYDHLLSCIAHAHSILSALPEDFNHMVKYSIASLFELVAQTIKSVFSLLGIQRGFGRRWSLGYLNQEAKDSMMQHGWCPSDITRTETKFLSIQAINIAKMMDKSLPERDHSRCSEIACNIYQVEMGGYKICHEQPHCSCEELVVHHSDLENILCKDDQFPLLRLTGDLHGLEAELVESDANTPYIAISHVWADGLGNPHSNSLHRCKLARLRELVSAVDNPDPSKMDAPLIWLDTLCCPTEDGEGKQKAIEKIRLVYQRAKHVLVLDAGLMSYESKSQGIYETIVRVFTSSWVRRLWTLQEGALGRCLHFQFADKAVSLSDLRASLGHHGNSVRHQVFALDALLEFWRINAFFKSSEHNIPGIHPSLVVLDQALQFRSVSVASDEPLCIGTLMSLDLPEILAVTPKEDRMQKVWELLAAQKGGIPAFVIFSEERRIEAKGWRWAPKTFLSFEKSIYQANERILRWTEGQLGIPTEVGLKVRFPGFRIGVRKYKDGKPRNPWPGLMRTPESYMHFRNTETGKWYKISDNKLGYLWSKWTTEEEKEEYYKLRLFPLHDMGDTDKAMIILSQAPDSTRTNAAIFAFPLAEEKREEGIAVRTERHIIVQQLMPEEGYIYDTIGKIAMDLRGDEMTDEHLELYNQFKAANANSPRELKVKIQENKEFKSSVNRLTEKMKTMMMQIIKEDSRFVEAVKMHFGSSFLEDMWVYIRDWFNHDFLGTRIDDMVWYVD